MNFPLVESEGTITIAQADTTTNEITTLIKHDNPQVEEGWVTLAFRAVGHASDVITPYCAFYFEGSYSAYSHELTGTPPGFTLTDDEGNTTVAPAATGNGNRFTVALNRQVWWQLNNGFKIRFKKTGTNGACTIYWRVLQR